MEEYIKGAMNGDEESLQRIYTLYKSQIYYFCLKLVADEEQAGNLTEETFECAYERLDTLAAPDQFEIWIKNIAAIRCFNYIHKMKPMLFLQAVGDTDEPLFSDTEILALPHGVLDEAQTAGIMDEMMNRLNDAQRMTLMFHYYNALSVSQIAKIMSCTTEIVKQRMTKAADHMKTTIAKLQDSGIVLKRVDFRTALQLQAACITVPTEVSNRIGELMRLIAARTVKAPEPESDAKTPTATLFGDLNNYSPDGADKKGALEEATSKYTEKVLTLKDDDESAAAAPSDHTAALLSAIAGFRKSKKSEKSDSAADKDPLKLSDEKPAEPIADTAADKDRFALFGGTSKPTEVTEAPVKETDNTANAAPFDNSDQDFETVLSKKAETAATRRGAVHTKPSAHKKSAGVLPILSKIKKLTATQQSVALLLCVVIVAGVIIGVSLSHRKTNPDLKKSVSSAQSAQDTSSAASSKAVLPIVKAVLKTETAEVKATDGTVVAKASYQYPVVTINAHPDAATKVNAVFESGKAKVLNTYASEKTQNECRYGYSTKSYGSWKKNENTVTMAEGLVNKKVLSFSKTQYTYTYGNVHGDTAVEGFCFSAESGEQLKVTDLVKNANEYYDFAADYIMKAAEKKRDAGEYVLYDDYDTTIRNTLKKSGRWYLSKEGLTVVFQPDELVYFTYGVQSFTLPKDQVTTYLKDATLFD